MSCSTLLGDGVHPDSEVVDGYYKGDATNHYARIVS